MIPLLDLTRLNAQDDEHSIGELCKKGSTPLGSVAALCILPQFVKLAAHLLTDPSIKLATVCNFPMGTATLSATLAEIEKALCDQANEIDLVFPYRAYIQGEKRKALAYVIQAKALCQGEIKLKVIIETGEIQREALIREIAREVILAGADFIKTSTGKSKQGATIAAAKTILSVIKEQASSCAHSLGLKVAGGIQTRLQAQSYIQVAEEIMGQGWVQPQVFRIGSSKLLDEIITDWQNKTLP